MCVCRRLKCDGWEGSIHCDQLPEVANFVAAARALQLARGLDDSEVRFFVGADQPESYQKARMQFLSVYTRNEMKSGSIVSGTRKILKGRESKFSDNFPR